MAINDELDSTNEVRTVVLVGRTGNGKSATGNSIIGYRAFKSGSSSAGVTSTCELQMTTLDDGLIINVIDTPGLFEITAEPKLLSKELVKCINMAKDGIHAVLVVLSTRTRYSREEEAAVESLRNFFGEKISDYMIVVFTGGDDLEDNDETLDDYLGRDCPEPLKKTLGMCGNRRIIFDNKTRNKVKKQKQLESLLTLVDTVIAKNNGKPYTDELFMALKNGAAELSYQTAEVNSSSEITELNEQVKKSYTEQFNMINEMVEVRLRDTTAKLQAMLAEEHAARIRAEENVQNLQMKYENELRKLREDLDNAKKEADEEKIRILRKDLKKAKKEADRYHRQGDAIRCPIL